MDLLSTIAASAGIIFCFMSFLFLVAIILKDNSIADIAWGIGFIAVTASAIYVNNSIGARQAAAALMVLIWGTRLAVRIYFRNAGRGEDWRYREWRNKWGKYFLIRSYLQVFMLQGAIMLVNLLPVLVIASSQKSSLTVLDGIGIAVWLTGFFFETVGDYQLDRFTGNLSNKGKLINVGLWNYSRHPNYFGEVVMWWGLFIMALSAPGGWVGIFGPAIITLMILFVSGIPLTEKNMEKYPGFAEYKRRTSVFVPWFRKK